MLFGGYELDIPDNKPLDVFECEIEGDTDEDNEAGQEEPPMKRQRHILEIPAWEAHWQKKLSCRKDLEHALKSIDGRITSQRPSGMVASMVWKQHVHEQSEVICSWYWRAVKGLKHLRLQLKVTVSRSCMVDKLFDSGQTSGSRMKIYPPLSVDVMSNCQVFWMTLRSPQKYARIFNWTNGPQIQENSKSLWTRKCSPRKQKNMPNISLTKKCHGEWSVISNLSCSPEFNSRSEKVFHSPLLRTGCIAKDFNTKHTKRQYIMMDMNDQMWWIIGRMCSYRLWHSIVTDWLNTKLEILIRRCKNCYHQRQRSLCFLLMMNQQCRQVMEKRLDGDQKKSSQYWKREQAEESIGVM